MKFVHKPIMLQECIELLKIRPDGKYVDGTVGGGGHSYEIAKMLNDKGCLIGIDRDTDAIQASSERLGEYGDKVRLYHGNFSEMNRLLNENAEGQVDGILLDLGVSSYQLDNGERGFSYQTDARLDMRMDRSQLQTAEDIVNKYDKDALANMIFSYGEDRWAKRIADFIVKYRETQKITTTGELVEIIKRAIPAPARRDGPHPAKRTFQALRIEVNNELGMLRKAIIEAVNCLNQGGRICIISFHSLEDRIVKQAFSFLEGRCTCPPDFPICMCQRKTYGKAVTKKPIEPSEQETEGNPRARSAKLRAFEKC